ncbi:phosphoribosylamine--glycine ligase [Enterococcus alishanensis]
MKILIIGSGGREHAIAKKILASPKVTEVFCAKGNPGMLNDGIQTLAIEEDNHPALIEFAKENQIEWTFVGPEVPLLNGIVDDFQAADLKIFGPNKAAAMIEGSKEFAKQIMLENQIPTAAYEVFTDFDQAQAYIKKIGTPIVIKADGLAAGKGVVVAQDEQEALSALDEMLNQNRFGESGAKVVIEEFLAGEEFSLLSFVRNNDVYPMVIAQDHKPAFEGNKGPNTGGMGAYSPVPQISESIINKAVENVVKPAVNGMVQNGTPFSGILYAGLIATSDGPKVIEFNARFGDPETQVVLPRLASDLAEVIDDLLHEKEPKINWYDFASVGVVIAADGYPGDYQKGMPVPTFDDENVNIFYAGVSDSDGLKANGGRVLVVEANGENISDAQQKVYKALEKTNTDGYFFRKDIGDKGRNK